MVTNKLETIQKLSDKGRMTPQKVRILEYLSSVTSHPNADQVYRAVKRSIPFISLATVYRNLNLMAEQGIIEKIEVNGEAHFDADQSFHQHAVCNSCGKIYDLFDPEITKYAMKRAQIKGFDVSGVSIMFTGLCDKCRPDKK